MKSGRFYHEVEAGFVHAEGRVISVLEFNRSALTLWAVRPLARLGSADDLSV